MADAELLLTVNGADVTDAVWEWGSVTLADRIDSFATLGFTIREAFGAVTSVPAFSDIRLVNLLTGAVLFDGVTTDGVTQRAVDPAWVETDVAATSKDVLFATSVMQSEYVYEYHLAVGTSEDWLDPIFLLLFGASFADARVPTNLVFRPLLAGDPPIYRPGDWAAGGVSHTFAQFDSLSAGIDHLAAKTEEWDGSGSYSDQVPFTAKWYPEIGLMLAKPSDAWRGAAPVTLTAASFGRPSEIDCVRDDSQTGSGGLNRDYWVGGVQTTVINHGFTGATNGYFVVKDEPAPWGSEATFYQITSPEMPHDVQVGHSLTFDHPAFGTVTGTVQGVQTGFLDGISFDAAQAWPEFLDAGLALDGTWTLDAARTRSIPRRARVSTITLSGNPRSFVKTLAAAGSL